MRHLSSISIDRFLVVAYPMKYRVLMRGKVILIWITAIWTVSGVIPLFRLFSDDSATSGRQAAFIFSVIIITLSAVTYSFTYYKLKKQSGNIVLQNSTKSRTQEIRIRKEKRFLQTIVIIACIAIACTLPYLVIMFRSI